MQTEWCFECRHYSHLAWKGTHRPESTVCIAAVQGETKHFKDCLNASISLSERIRVLSIGYLKPILHVLPKYTARPVYQYVNHYSEAQQSATRYLYVQNRQVIMIEGLLYRKISCHQARSGEELYSVSYPSSNLSLYPYVSQDFIQAVKPKINGRPEIRNQNS